MDSPDVSINIFCLIEEFSAKFDIEHMGVELRVGFHFSEPIVDDTRFRPPILRGSHGVDPRFSDNPDLRNIEPRCGLQVKLRE
jgi:hypothetical protein